MRLNRFARGSGQVKLRLPCHCTLPSSAPAQNDRVSRSGLQPQEALWLNDMQCLAGKQLFLDAIDRSSQLVILDAALRSLATT